MPVIYVRPVDLSVDETLLGIRQAVDQLGAKRVVIDSFTGFELDLAPTFREDFRESLYRIVGALTGMGVTMLMTVELTQTFTDMSFSPHAISFLTVDLILQRYMEMDGQLRKMITVVKMRGSQHSKDLRAYEVTSAGLVVGESLRDYRGVITGVPERRQAARPTYPGLTEQEVLVLGTPADLKEATADAVAARTGLRRPELARVLNRLLALNYAIRATEQEQAVYRPAARAL